MRSWIESFVLETELSDAAVSRLAGSSAYPPLAARNAVVYEWFCAMSNKVPIAAPWRARLFGGIVALAFATIAVRLVSLQLVQGSEFEAKSRNNFVQFIRLEHTRGEIADREGRILVTNRPSLNVYVTPAFFPNARRTVRALAVAAGRSLREADTVSRALSRSVREHGPPLLLARDLGVEDVLSVRRAREDLSLPLGSIHVIKAPVKDGEPTYAVYLDPDRLPTVGLVLRRVSDMMELAPEARRRLSQRVRGARGLARYANLIVRRDLPPQVEGPLSLAIQLGELPGVTVRPAYARSYLYGTLAAHVVGYTNELSPRELEARRSQGYRLGDSIGRRGVERTFEEDLRGTDGRRTVVVDSKGREQPNELLPEALGDGRGADRTPLAGNRVVLTVDLDLQREAEQLFAERAGAVVVLETDTGRILTMTSTPSFDPSRVAGRFDAEEKARLDRLRTLTPWRFRAIQNFYAPGSTFKVVTALAALEAGVVRPEERIHCPGAFRLGRARFRCWKDEGHESVDLLHSIARSCDVYYYILGTRLGLNAIARVARDLGFGRPTGVGLPSESAGIMPDVAWYDLRRGEGYTLGAAVNAAIGQGAVSVTPLQLAVAYAAIANGGRVMKPQVALAIESFDGDLIRRFEPSPVRELAYAPESLALIREGLRQVVNAPYGTAYGKRLKSLTVSGKTGTAQVAKLGKDREKSRRQVWELRDHAWFAAIAPAADPEIVVVVFVEHGGGGSKTAAPIAMRVVDAWWKKRRAQARLPVAGPLHIAVMDGDPLHRGHDR